MNSRLQSDFTSAYNSTAKALEDIVILGLSLVVVGTFALAIGAKNLRAWIVAQRTWAIPGKEHSNV